MEAIKDTGLIQEKEGQFFSSVGDHSHIYYKHYLPKRKLKKKFIHVIFQHGMIEYHKRHEEFFYFLIEHFGDKIVISTMDLYGHGLSGGQRAYINDFESYIEDMMTFFKLCHEELHTGHEVETFLVSHSLGGLITMKTLGKEGYQLPFENLRGVIFSNPCVSPKIELPQFVKNFIDAIPNALSHIRVPVIYDGHDLTHDREKANQFIQDYLISKYITVKLASETGKAVKNVNSLSYFFDYPSYFLLSGDDMVVDIKKAKLFITGMNKEYVKESFYPKMKHDLLNETCRSEVFQEIMAYINERSGL